MSGDPSIRRGNPSGCPFSETIATAFGRSMWCVAEMPTAVVAWCRLFGSDIQLVEHADLGFAGQYATQLA